MNMEKRGGRGVIGKVRCKAGETLTETLVTMLIIGLSSVLFLTMVGASGRIFQRAKARYDVLYTEITAADEQSGTGIGSDDIGAITVTGLEPDATSVTVKVDWYGSEDYYVLSYKVK